MDDGRGDAALMYRKTCKLALLAYAALLLYAGWMPLTVNLDGRRVRQEFQRAVAPSGEQCLAAVRSDDGRKNLLLFVPLGGLAVAAGYGRRRTWLLVPLAGAAALALSLMIETGQLFVVGRCADIRDLLTNGGGGLVGALFGTILIRPARLVAARLAPYLRNRHAFLGAVLLATALIAAVAWRIRPSAAESVPWSRIVWSISGGLAQAPLHHWLGRHAGSFAALTLLVAMATGGHRLNRRRALAAAAVVTGLAIVLESLRLLVPGESASLAAVLVAAAASFGAGLAAPALQRRPFTLATGVLLCAGVLLALLAGLSWASSGGQTRWPLWGLYRHEYAWAYYATIRRCAVAAGASALLAFYFSLHRPWRLRYRMLAGAAVAMLCAAAIEAAKSLAGPAGGSLAIFLENSMAAVLGTLLFVLVWRVLDRRGQSNAGVVPDRRREVAGMQGMQGIKARE